MELGSACFRDQFLDIFLNPSFLNVVCFCKQDITDCAKMCCAFQYKDPLIALQLKIIIM